MLISQMASMFMFSAVGVTLPAISRELHAGGVALGLIEAVYLGASSAVLLPLGKLADLTDRRTIFKIGLALFTLTTLLLGLTHHTPSFIALRLLQGLAAAMMIAVNMAILTEVIPRNALGRALGLSVGAVYVGLSTGPFIGGILTTHLGWRSVYYFGALFTTLAWLLAFRNLPSQGRLKLVRIDIWGSVCIVGAIALLIAGSSLHGDGSAGYGMMLAGLALFALFIQVERRVADPLIALSMVTDNPVFARAVLAQLINYTATFAITFLFSLYLQSVKGMSPQKAGFILMTAPVTMALLSPFFGRLSDRVPPQKIAFTGMLFCFFALCGAGFISERSSVWQVCAVLLCQGTGIAMFSSPNMNIMMNCVQKSQYGIAAALTANLRTLGMVFSMIIVITFISIFIGHTTIGPANVSRYLSAMHFSIMTFVSLSAFGLLSSLHFARKAAPSKGT